MAVALVAAVAAALARTPPIATAAAALAHTPPIATTAAAPPVGLPALAASPAPAAGTVTTTALPGVDDPWMSFAMGADGTLWCSIPRTTQICRITDDGVTTYTHPDLRSVHGLTAGGDGALWFIRLNDYGLGRVTVDGEFTLFPPITDELPRGIFTASDGAVWVQAPGSALVRRGMDGTVSTFADPLAHSRAVPDRDGGVWYGGSGLVIHMTAEGQRTLHPVPASWYHTPQVALAADGVLWATVRTDALARRNDDGSWTEVPAAGLGFARSLTAGADGALWFVHGEWGNYRLARVTTTGTVTTLDDPLVASPDWLFPGPDGSLVWANASTLPPEHRIGRVQVTGAPGAPHSVTATPASGGATVSWTPPFADGGRPVAGYTVTASPGGATCSWATGPLACTVTGLRPSALYTFTVTATTAAGTGPPSTASAGIAPVGPPVAPTPVDVGAGFRSAGIRWGDPPADGGRPITGFSVTASPGGATCTTHQWAQECTIESLTAGVSYTFTVTAANDVGTSPPSAPSAAVVPYGAPAPPRNVRTEAGPGFAIVTWDPPVYDGARPIEAYAVRAEPGEAVCLPAVDAYRCLFTRLDPTVSYTFAVTATNDGWWRSVSPPETTPPMRPLDRVAFGYGALDRVTAGPASITATGWAIDPGTPEPTRFFLIVNDVWAPEQTAADPRPDLGAAFPLYGSDHGFTATVAAAPGPHRVCLLVQTGFGSRIDPCRDLVVPGGEPFGALDVASASAGSVTVQGWALDPDTADAIPVAVYVDGRNTGWFTADRSRPDVGWSFPGWGDGHGYEVTVPASPGPHTVCTYAINAGPGGNPALGCRSVAVATGSPIGAFDAVAAGPGSVTVKGWALDPDTADAIPVAVYVDGRNTGWFTADRSRPDVGWSFPGWGDRHGYEVSVPASPGPHTVCTYAINAGPGGNPALGCRSVIVPTGDPFGALDVVGGAPGSVSVRGWAIDPDTADATAVAVYVDGQPAGRFPAAGDRPDVGAAFPGYGSGHGYAVTVPASGGVHQVCVYAIDVGGSRNTTLGCRSVTVPA